MIENKIKDEYFDDNFKEKYTFNNLYEAYKFIKDNKKEISENFNYTTGLENYFDTILRYLEDTSNEINELKDSKNLTIQDLMDLIVAASMYE